jgi:hypothetical protein
MAGRVSQARFEQLVASEFAAQPLTIGTRLREEDLASLPPPVQRYVRASGTIGKPRPQNVRFEFDAVMRRNVPAWRPPMIQLLQPARLFLEGTRRTACGQDASTGPSRRRSGARCVPCRHDRQSVSDQPTETVTALNDLCIFAPVPSSRTAGMAAHRRTERGCDVHERAAARATLSSVPTTSWSTSGPTIGPTPAAAHPCRCVGHAAGGTIDGIRVVPHGSTVYARPEGPSLREFTSVDRLGHRLAQRPVAEPLLR